MISRYERKYGSHYGPVRRSWVERNRVFLVSGATTAIALILYTIVVLVTFCHLGPEAISFEVGRTVSVLVAQMGGE